MKPDSTRSIFSNTLTSCNCNLSCASLMMALTFHLPVQWIQLVKSLCHIYINPWIESKLRGSIPHYLLETHWQVGQSSEQMREDFEIQFVSVSQELYHHIQLCWSILRKHNLQRNIFRQQNNHNTWRELLYINLQRWYALGLLLWLASLTVSSIWTSYNCNVCNRLHHWCLMPSFWS